MSTTQPPRLGACPECGTTIASTDVTLRDDAGQPAVYTCCPDCRDLVNPV